ncbi:MAG: CPBP family intramembrane metalloprotease [Thermoplasmata archaeon]|nr:CPBP family intramembrane metalloprotease [Thermoplasmata archaeon]MBE3140585.1 CPBP family intramembrane metalloprotease [Thermoplasmata archaeon]
MRRSSNKTFTIVMISLVIAIILFSTFAIFFGVFNQQTQSSEGVYTSDIGTMPQTAEKNYFLNLTIIDESIFPIKNVHIAIFRNGFIEADAFTNLEGKVSFYLAEGQYYVQFEKFHYAQTSKPVDLTKNIDATQTMTVEEAMLFGMFPSWAVMLLIGLAVILLIYLEREKLHLGSWGKPDNWFGGVRDGKWTFIDKSTKKALYAITFMLLLILIVWVVPNAPMYEHMAYYYILLGGVSIICLLLEGMNHRFWIAAIGFGRKNEIMGNMLIGLSFSFIFIGIIGFTSQLELIPVANYTLLSLLMVGIVASFFEEAFFSGILAPTFAEKIGILPSIFTTSILFMFGHTLAYGWAFIPLISALLFRIFATAIVLHRKSWLGVFVAHAIINILSVVTIMMVA